MIVSSVRFLKIFVKDPAPAEIYTYCHALALPEALRVSRECRRRKRSAVPARQQRSWCWRSSVARWPSGCRPPAQRVCGNPDPPCNRRSTMRRRSAEHTYELQSLMRISYAGFCLKKKTTADHEDGKNRQLEQSHHY